MGYLVIMVALVVLFPIGWLVSKELYLKLVFGVWAASMLAVLGFAIWSWASGHGFPRLR